MSHDSDPFELFKGLKKIPFLLPKAPPYSSAKHVQSYQTRAAEADAVGRKRGKSPIDMLPTGPRADDKVKRALSGPDASETISRIGRATRRQDKEFAARVHPISGRVEHMVRGDHVSTHQPFGATKSMKRMAEMAEKAKSPQVRDRAMRNISNQNPNLRGPDRIYVHNHPSNPGGKTKIRRAYPSAADTQLKDALRPAGVNYKGVVVSHQPGPRGAKKTKAVYFGQGPDKLKRGRQQRPVEGGNQQAAFSVQDNATAPKNIERVFRSDSAGPRNIKRRQFRISQRIDRNHAERDDLRGGELKDYDKFVRERSASPEAATRSGLHTRERMMKRLNPFGIVHKGVLKDPTGAVATARKAIKFKGRLRPVQKPPKK